MPASESRFPPGSLVRFTDSEWVHDKPPYSREWIGTVISAKWVVARKHSDGAWCCLVVIPDDGIYEFMEYELEKA